MRRGVLAAVACAIAALAMLRSTPGQMSAPLAGATLVGQVTARFVPTPGYPVASMSKTIKVKR
jgi:hypothetical protein